MKVSCLNYNIYYDENNHVVKITKIVNEHEVYIDNINNFYNKLVATMLMLGVLYFPKQ